METLTKIFGAIVGTFFTTQGGVSISEIGRIQAENKQQNDQFWGRITDAIGGVFRKTISFLGAGDSTPRRFDGAVITADQIKEFSGVAERNAQTSSLMHAVKLWKRRQAQLQEMDLRLQVVDTLPAAPIRPTPAETGTLCSTEQFMELSNIDEMIAQLESPVLAQFDWAFWTDANELNSRAAVLGKLLSEQGAFFRKLNDPLPKSTEQFTQTGVVITQWERAYTDAELEKFSGLRDTLQAEYNDLQKQLNGCRKQIKDAVRAFNLEQERQYQTAYSVYKVEAEKHALEMERIRSAAETLRQQALQEIATLKVRTE